MSERKRPDPRLNSLPEGYEFQLRVRPNESVEEARTRILNQAQAAERLLRDQDFNDAYQEILEEQVQQIITSKPGQSELRDDAYFRIRGIQEIAYKMNTWRMNGERLKEHLAAEAALQENQE